MHGFSSVHLIGNLTHKPLLNYAVEGLPVAKCSIAVGRRYKKDGEQMEETSFFEVVAFRQTAENFCKLTDKGYRVFIQGMLQQQRWRTDGGETRSKTIIIIGSFLSLQPGHTQVRALNAKEASVADAGDYTLPPALGVRTHP